MIYILIGNDRKNKNVYLKKLVNENKPVFLSTQNVSKEIIKSYAENVSLFGDSPIIIIDNLINEGEIVFSKEEIEDLKNSQTIFVFLEDKLLVTDEKKYSKYGTIEKFNQKEVKKIVKDNTFSIADSFGRKDKIGTWVLYREAIEKGIAPENISGILFWKIKTMILNKDKTFKEDVLKKQSSEIVTLHHKAHRGEVDFIVGLEQFILNSLS